MLGNPAMIIAGMVVGAAGTLLTQLMAKAMNRSLGNVLFASFGETPAGGAAAARQAPRSRSRPPTPASRWPTRKGHHRPGLRHGGRPGAAQGVGVAQLLLDQRRHGQFAIHPVAGRMPGHMNVLLAEAGVPYDFIYDIDEINAEFATADVALVIGANDMVNLTRAPTRRARSTACPSSTRTRPKNVIVIKRGQGQGFSGVDNALFGSINAHAVRRRAGGARPADPRVKAVA